MLSTATTDAVIAMQEKLGSRAMVARLTSQHDEKIEITGDLAGFIGQLDSFYLATASADGRPYVQHRGGKPGFLKILDDRTLVFADYPGNKQYFSLGNLSENDRVALFLMDYPAQQRIKVWGRAEIVEDDAALLASLTDPDLPRPPERAIKVTIEAWDVNCPKHITPRYTEAHVAQVVEKLTARVAELEAKLAAIGG